MPEYIDKTALLSRIESQAREWSEEYDAQQILGDIEDFPTADVAPVIHAHWIICSDGYYPYCSNCKKEPSGREMTDYCPNCGADMREERDDG